MSKLSRSKHMSFEQLADLAEGRLHEAEADRARLHLATCDRCAADLAWIERTLLLMQTDDSKDAPTWVINRAARIFPALQPRGTESGWRQAIRALLTFDSRQQLPALGLRSSGTIPARQLLYSAEGRDIDVRVTPEGSKRRLEGQILGEDAAGRVLLNAGDAVAAEADINSLGEFVLPPVAPGHYAMTLRLPDVDVAIDDLVLE